jgi:hypothetical protein
VGGSTWSAQRMQWLLGIPKMRDGLTFHEAMIIWD